MKKDIFFKGKIKKEYFSYIFGCMIFFILLFVVGGALCIYAFVLEGSFHVSGVRSLLAIFGIVSFVLGGGYVFPQLFIIRNFPKYPKLRRIFFNSDIYFTDSTSNEYFGGSRTLRGRRNKATFEIVTAVAEAEKRMGNKKPIRYTVYCAFMLLFSVIGLVCLFAIPLLFENGTIFPNMSDDAFLLCWISGSVVCIAFSIFFLSRALKIARLSSSQNHSWRFDLYELLVHLSCKSNKRDKFWYDIDQLEKIEKIVKSTSKNAELRLEMKGNKTVSFTVVDKTNNSVIFKGLFR
ncbi:MAG: hypothetical protein IKC26_03415 [Clostridia bacterium]|nr:hypothetical protein [Clostridia bacterium]